LQFKKVVDNDQRANDECVDCYGPPVGVGGLVAGVVVVEEDFILESREQDVEQHEQGYHTGEHFALQFQEVNAFIVDGAHEASCRAIEAVFLEAIPP
jgi:hypothetical protein